MGSSDTFRKRIGSREYTYDHVLDVIAEGSTISSTVPLDRTQTSDVVDLCLEVSTLCNVACDNCFSHSWAGRDGRHAPVEQIVDAISRARIRHYPRLSNWW